MAANRIVVTAALLTMFGTAHATRVIEQPERSFELSLSQLTLPSTNSGGLTVKACVECAYSTHVVTSATQYFVNRQIVPFADFSRIAGELRANRSALETTVAGVFIDVDTGRVTRVTLLYRGQ